MATFKAVFPYLVVRAFIEAREHQAAAASLTGFPYSFAGTFNKTDQYPLKMTVGPFGLYLEV